MIKKKLHARLSRVDGKGGSLWGGVVTGGEEKIFCSISISDRGERKTRFTTAPRKRVLQEKKWGGSDRTRVGK